MGLQNEDFTTIDHDTLHMKEFMNQCKFCFNERHSKLDFFQNINNEPGLDILEILTSSKKQLKEVKAVFRQLDVEIKNISMHCYEHDKVIKKQRERLAELEEQEKVLSEKYALKKSLIEKQKVEALLNDELNLLEAKINQIYSETNDKKELLGKIDSSKSLEEEASLKEQKNDLLAKQKRLTIVNIENYIEDIYYWHNQVNNMFSALLGNLSASITEDGCILNLRKDMKFVDAVIKNRKLVEVNISMAQNEEVNKMLEDCREYALKINDVRTILIAVALYGHL